MPTLTFTTTVGMTNYNDTFPENAGLPPTPIRPAAVEEIRDAIEKLIRDNFLIDHVTVTAEQKL